jgi:1,2-diacylglycerol 3-alpha-glucosyltransferase
VVSTASGSATSDVTATPTVSTSGSRDPVIVLACPGLDHAHRGFETFARECFEALRRQPRIAIELVKGSGTHGSAESTVPTLRRDTPTARALGRLLRRDPFVIEHLSFALALIPRLARQRPDLVYFSEWHVGRVLALWRRVSRQRFKLVLCNGCLAPGPYPHLDHVQQLLPGALEAVVSRGVSPANQFVLPLGIAVDPAWRAPTHDEISRLRRGLGVPVDRRIVLSVGALNAQKRHDYVIEEIGSLPEPRPFLLLVGQPEDQATELATRAAQRLGADGHRIMTIPSARMPDVYRASDVFVLASLWEGSPRALIEALAQGLPCLTHDYPVMAWILDGHGRSDDLRQAGRLARMLAELTENDFGPEARRARHASVYERFSWDRLAPSYVDLLRSCAFDDDPQSASGELGTPVSPTQSG